MLNVCCFCCVGESFVDEVFIVIKCGVDKGQLGILEEFFDQVVIDVDVGDRIVFRYVNLCRFVGFVFFFCVQFFKEDCYVGVGSYFGSDYVFEIFYLGLNMVVDCCGNLDEGSSLFVGSIDNGDCFIRIGQKFFGWVEG